MIVINPLTAYIGWNAPIMAFQKFNIPPEGQTPAFDPHLCSVSGEFEPQVSSLTSLHNPVSDNTAW